MDGGWCIHGWFFCCTRFNVDFMGFSLLYHAFNAF